MDTSHLLSKRRSGNSEEDYREINKQKDTMAAVSRTHSQDSLPSLPASSQLGDDKEHPPSRFAFLSSIRIVVLLILCLQNSLYTVIRRFSIGVRQEQYSKYEVLLVGEIIKMIVSAYMVMRNDKKTTDVAGVKQRLGYLISTSQKMVGLALLYGAMNILSLVSLKNIGAGMFTIFAQCKILTTAICSTIILRRQYSSTQWRALIALSLGVLLFSQPIWDKDHTATADPTANVFVGTVAVLIEVSLSGFASIYFEKVIKTDPLKLSIWERNFQLAAGSIPVYVVFMLFTSDSSTIGAGWTFLAWGVALLGAAGGLLVALSIKYGDSILKTLATTGAILLSSVLDRVWLGGPLTPAMVIAAGQVILAICNYTFDTTPATVEPPPEKQDQQQKEQQDDEEMAPLTKK
jgi:UDP-sugar transporter A1/2/3